MITKIQFNTVQDVLNFSNQLIENEKSEDASKLAACLLVDSLGDTYFIPDIAKLSEKEAQESNITFRINNERVQEEIKLHEVWLKIKNENVQELNLIYNHTLAHALLRINNNRNSVLLDHGIPVNLVDPVIAISGADHSFHNYHDIRAALRRAKKEENQSFFGVETGVNINANNKQHLLLNNHALQELLEVYIEQCKIVDGEVKASDDIEQYKEALKKQDAYWAEKEKHCVIKKGNFFANYSTNELQQRVADIDENIRQNQVKRERVREKASKIIAHVGNGLTVLGLVVMIAAAVATCMTPFGIITGVLIGIMVGAMVGSVIGQSVEKTAHKPDEKRFFMLPNMFSNHMTAEIDNNLQNLNTQKIEHSSEIERRSKLPADYINKKVTKEKVIQEKRQPIREKIENLQMRNSLWAASRDDDNHQHQDELKNDSEKTPLLTRNSGSC